MQLVPFVCEVGSPSSFPINKYGARYVVSYLQKPYIQNEENTNKTNQTFTLIRLSTFQLLRNISSSLRKESLVSLNLILFQMLRLKEI